MAQHDFVISNAGFPATRADINNFLQAVATTHSGTSTPSGAVAGTIWLDTTTATAPILKYYDGTDNITLATIDHVANTVNFSDSALDLITDTTPQLGGNLDVNGNSIVSTSNANITLAPNGTGDVVLSADTVKIGDANANATITTDGTGDLILNTNSGSSSGSITIADGADANITIEPNGTGDVLLNADTVRVGDSGANATITSNGAGDLILNTNSGTNSGSITIKDGANGDIEILPNGTGVVKLDGLSYPTADGTSNQALVTNGSGVLSFATVGGSFADGTAGSPSITFASDTNTGIFRPSADTIAFTEGGTEAMRIDSSGKVLVGLTSTPTAKFAVLSNVTFDPSFLFSNSTTAGAYNMFIRYTAQAPDDNSSRFLTCDDTGTDRLIIFSDGDVKNHDNSYGSISDERIKQDIRDSNSQWNDIKNIRVRNFKKKDDVRQYGQNAWEQIGVIAQELETVSPKLIKHTNPTTSDILSDASFGTLYQEGDEIPEGKKVGDVKETYQQVKGVSYSVLYMKAIKALQEAMERIEQLETKNTSLEARLTALES